MVFSYFSKIIENLKVPQKDVPPTRYVPSIDQIRGAIDESIELGSREPLRRITPQGLYKK